jgi:hypothetical protein
MPAVRLGTGAARAGARGAAIIALAFARAHAREMTPR